MKNLKIEKKDQSNTLTKNMKKMNIKIDIKTILDIQSVSGNQNRMQKVIKAILHHYDINFYTDSAGNILADKGDTEYKPLIACHTDTVHSFVKGYKVHLIDGNYIALNSDFSQVGTGGDDNVGIWAALNLLINNDNIKAGFFVDEEIGCIGSSKVDSKFIENVSYILQTDRVGNNDFITGFNGENTNAIFDKIVKSTVKQHKYKFRHQSSVTDSMTIGENYGIVAVNISSGYYKPHTENETVNVKDANNALSLMQSILNIVPIDNVYECDYIPYDYNSKDFYYDNDFYYDDNDDSDDKYIFGNDESQYIAHTCPKCKENELFHIVDDFDNSVGYCYNCEDYIYSAVVD